MDIKGYRATEDGETLIVHDVPIFVECERGENVFDADWIREAVALAKKEAAGGYHPPLHIRHHEMATELNDSVRPAGFFRITGAKSMTFKGEKKLAIFADLHVTHFDARHDIIANRLPYRSVEIFNVDEPGIGSLALLDHEAPYLQLPMLFVDVEKRDANGEILPTYATASFSNPWAKSKRPPSGLVACFRRGESAVIITKDPSMEDDQNTNDEAETVESTETGAQNFNAPPFEKKDDGEEGTEGGEAEGDESTESPEPAKLDCGAVCDAIMDGSITVADYKNIRAAMDQQEAAAAAAEQPQPNPMQPGAPAAQQPAQAPAPNQAMSNSDDSKQITAREATLQGRIDALEAANAERDAADTRRRDVDEAMQRLEGRPLGADFRSKLEDMHTSGGPEAFRKYVDSMVDTFAAAATGDGARAAAFAAQSEDLSPVAASFQEEGPEAVELAAKFSAEWAQLRGFTRMSEEEYVKTNMARRN